MNCIFCCIFNQEKYVEMFYLLLESVFICGNLDDNTEILIYTSLDFMNIIKNSHLYNNKIKFEINNTYNNVDKACKSRLDVFNLNSISRYEKILYLDTDILIKNNIINIFDMCKEDILYVLEENTIDDISDYWGRSLFKDEINNYEDKSAFTSGILLFKNCEKIKELFNNINKHIIDEPYQFSFYDQPYIVYNAFKYNMFNNKLLKSHVVNNDLNIYSDKHIHHFPGGPGKYEHKIISMNTFLNNIKENIIINNINNTIEYINNNLSLIINNCGELLEGNIFMLHHTNIITDVFLNKIKNISNLLLNKNIKYVLEIGFNAGFSTLLMLLSNPNVHITCVDLGEHSYTIPCYNKLKETFSDRITLIIGNSINVLKTINTKFDLIHIDGGHATEVAESDIKNSYLLSKQGTVLIMDDYDFNNLHELWDKYINKLNLKKLDIQLYETVHHDIKYVNF